MLNKTSAQTTAQQGDQATIENLERKWSAAVVKGDPSPLEQILSEDCTLIGPDGAMLTKSQVIAAVRSGDFKFQSLDPGQMQLRTYGDAAVVTGGGEVKGQYKDRDLSGTQRWTDTFIKLQGRWQCVASQVVHMNL
jgi:ketosteroid isomerase-like protein